MSRFLFLGIIQIFQPFPPTGQPKHLTCTSFSPGSPLESRADFLALGIKSAALSIALAYAVPGVGSCRTLTLRKGHLHTTE